MAWQNSIAQSMEGDRYVREECLRVAEFRVRGGEAPYTYTWELNGEIIQVDENLGPSEVSILTQAQRGTYIATVVDAKGDIYSDTFTFQGSSNFTLDIEFLEENECDGITYGRIEGVINNGLSPFIVTIYDEFGQVVQSTPISGNTINLSGFPAGSYVVEVENANGCVEYDEVELEEIEPIEFDDDGNLGAFPVTCEDNGSISYNILGYEGEVRFRIRRASGGYVNPWTVANGGEVRFDGLPIGDYFLEISDAFRLESCPEELPFSIIDESLFYFDSTPSNITCFGESDGSILFEITRNYTDINPLPTEVYVSLTNSSGLTIVTEELVNVDATSGQYTFTNLPADTYTITTKHGGLNYPECMQTFTVEINGPPALLTTTRNAINVQCFGESTGQASVTPAGGWGGYTFAWDNGATTSQISNLEAGNYYVDITDAGGCTIREEFEIIGPPAILKAEIEVVRNLTCVGSNDGIARVYDITGGYGGYTIEWSIGNQSTEEAYDLPEGQISVTITDSEGCSIILYENVTAPPAPLVLDFPSPVTCFGADDGSVRIIVDDTAAYEITIGSETLYGSDVTFDKLTAGNYTAVISYENSCKISRNITIGTPSRVQINATNLQRDNISCNGLEDGSISGLTANGGTGTLSYQWYIEDNGSYIEIPEATTLNLNDLGVGTYKIVVTDENGCFDEEIYTITEPDALQVSAPTTTPVSCFGSQDGSVSFNISGGRTPYAYSLNNGTFVNTSNQNITINNLPAGTNNTIVVRDASGCSLDEFEFDIDSPTQIEIDLVSITPETCFGQENGSIQIETNGGSGGLKHEWYIAGDFSTVIATTEDLTNVGPGSYTVRVSELTNDYCYVQETFIIPPTPALQITLDGSPVHINCFGESTGAINVQASGGTGSYTYEWTGSNGFTADTQNISDIPAGTYRVRVTDENGCYDEIVDIQINQPVAGIEIQTLALNSPSCPDANDGSIQIQVSGGTPGYNISWQKENENGDFESFPGASQSLIGVPAGTYKILVSDAAGCIHGLEIILEGPDQIVVNIEDLQNVSCFGRNDGRINIGVTGGTFPYFYEWSHGFINQNPRNLGEGTYSVTITDARGCIAILEDIVISQPEEVAINIIDISEPSCDHNDGRIEVEFVGGDASFASQWYRLPDNILVAENVNFLENITPGVYSVTYGSSATCSFSRIITVPGPTNPLQLNVSAQDPTCDNDNGIIAISAAGGVPGYQFFVTVNGIQEELTSNIIANLEAGDYEVTVRDSRGCEVSRSITISNPNQPIYDIEKIQDVSCFGGNDGIIKFETFGDFSEITFQWFRRETTGTNTPIALDQLDELIAGRYFVRFTYDNNCTLDSDDYIITQPDEIIVISQVEQLTCFDDLGQIILNITGGNPDKSITLTGDNGYTNTISNFFTGAAEFENLPAGIYTYTISDPNCTPFNDDIEIFSIQQPVFTFSKTDVYCFGDETGSIEIIDIDVETNRTYTIILNGTNRGMQTSFTNLPAGIYTLQLVDNFGCESLTQNITINQPTRPLQIFNLATVNNTCFEGTEGEVSFEILGGTEPYTYTLTGNNGYSQNASALQEGDIYEHTDLRAGLYTLTVLDQNGNCQAVETFFISEPTELTLTENIGEIACPGDVTFIALTMNGGTPPYQYVWEAWDSNLSVWTTRPSTSNRLDDITPGLYRYTATDQYDCTEFKNEITIDEAPPVSIDYDNDDILCYGGSTTVRLTASRPGATNFTFFVNGNQIFGNTFTAIAGSYEAYALDNRNGCVSDPITIEVNQPDAPLAYQILDVKDLSCFETGDGEISFTLTGGTAPYQIQFGSETRTAGENDAVTFSGLSANVQYLINVEDENGCLINIPPITLNQPFPLQANHNITPIQCFDGEGSIAVQTTGGRIPITITWEYAENGVDFIEMPSLEGQFNALNLKSGTYRYTIADAGGCTSMDNIVVLDQPTQTTLDFVVEDVSCYQGNDGVVRLIPSGGPSASYQLYFNGNLVNGTEITGLSAGTYEAFAVSGGCPSDRISIVVSQPSEALRVSLDYPNEVFCHNDEFIIGLEISGGNETYEASMGQDFFPVDGSGLFTFENILPGTYTIEVRDQKGCSWTRTITIANPPALEIDLISLEHVSCHDGEDGSLDVSAQGGSGQLSFEWRDESGNVIGNNSSISGLSPGIYQVTVSDERNCFILENFQIDNIDPISIEVNNVNHVLCHGGRSGNFLIEASGGNGDYIAFVNNIRSDNLSISNLQAGTYEVYVEDRKGCVSPTVEVTITAPDPIVIDIDVTPISCFGASDGQAEITASGGTEPYTIRWSDGSTDWSRNDLMPGIFEVVITDSNGCVARENLIVRQPEPLNTTAQVNPVSCVGGNDGSISLTLSGGTGVIEVNWFDDANNPIGEGTLIEDLLAGTYRAEIEDSRGCSISRTFIVTEPFEAIQVTPFIGNVRCSGDSNGRIDLIVTGGTAPYTYEWSNGASTRNISNLQGGIYQVNITDANGCIFTDEYQVLTPDPININLVSLENVSCSAGNDGSIQIAIEGGTGDYQIQWSTGDQGLTIENLMSGMYTVFVFDENTCFASETFFITQPDAPLSVQANIPTEICNPEDSLNVTLNVQGGTAPYSYLWSNGATTESIQNIQPGEYAVTVTDSNGCTTFIEIDVPSPAPAMQLTLEGTTAICSTGGRAEVTANISGGVAPYSYLWSTGASGPTASNLIPGNYTLTVTDAAGCSIFEEIEILPALDLAIRLDELDAVSCFGAADGRISITTSGGLAPYEIIWSHGPRDVTTVAGLEAGNYTVTIRDATGCNTTATYNIREPELLSYREVVNNVSCFGANNGAIELNVTGGTAPYTYRWSNGFNGRNPRNLAPGIYSVVITDRNGCSTGGSFGISEPSALLLESDHSQELSCHGDMLGFINLNISGGMQPYRVIWSDDDQVDSFNRAGLAAGSYSVTIIDDNNCIVERTFEIREPEPLQASLLHRFDIDCENKTLTGIAWLEISGGTSAYEISWYNGDSNTTETQFFQGGEVSAIITDANGCQFEISDQIELPLVFTDADFVYTIPSIGTTGEILVHDEVQFIDRTLGNVIAWEWDFGDGNGSTSQNPSHTYSRPGTYQIRLKTFDIFGCVSEAEIAVEVLASYRVMIPNAFTPNGDGVNDLFFPKVRGVKTYEFYIFNKWGELIYTNMNGEDEGWDGRLNGKMSPNGNYVYKLVFEAEDGEKGSQTGVFTLIN
ncbi:gliding motility-associated C-terminal domain-containing protein [Belliella sp. DSM 111904]|uniref:Gliding motility-associated C-terminal domain-containing protein n=1 Tax=Belliella filtrata TaxID=2923435 RepID=A0ABS9UXH1_9BACT|nr:T9SS type B sorting domain-containing protein [Belliella filtrata]MCH7408415.1 gliding motility-associated C-terminal domain-containing protein [Belliella filtrata]